MSSAGARTRRISFERATVTTDDHGGEVSTWSPVADAFAEVLFGTGQERREAAQEQASVSATFIVIATPTTSSIRPTDRIAFDGGYWDIVSNVPVGLNKERHISATRAV